MLLNQYFGQYLLNKQILSAKQLREAFAFENSAKLKLGVLAINAGLMNASQVEEVHELQKAKDKKFGELAIEAGYLSLAKLEELLEVQRSRQMSLSQAVVDLGFLDLAQLEKALADYKNESKFTNDQWQSLRTADFEQAAHLFLNFSKAGGIGEIYYDYVGLFLRNLNRFICNVPVLQSNIQLSEYNATKWLVTQNVVGEVNLFTGIALDDKVFLEIARRYSQEDLNEIDELAECSVAEFLNVVNGIFCVNASDQGVDLDLRPQCTTQCTSLALTKGYRIPIELDCGRLELILAEGLE
ncbi:hypothetical protein [Dendrosporobacter sp. 1207_IL3150]|uniref:hypothetical protein n=1 Tax=Dendrosporobacter sp. 1207_IL3150 TaxID=3084054 RepID=UPI002FDB2143